MVIFSLFSGGVLVILGILVLLLFIGSRGRIVFSSAYYARKRFKIFVSFR